MNPIYEFFLYPLSPILSPIFAGLLIIAAECFPSFPLKGLKTALAVLGVLGTLFFTWWIGGHWPIPYTEMASAATPPQQALWLTAFLHNFRLDHTSLLFFAAIGVFTFLSLIFMQ